MKKIAFNKFIVVVWYEGIPYMLQNRGVVSNIFYNNGLRVFSKLNTAITNANSLSHRYKYDSIKVYRIFDADESIGTDEIRKWDREQTERIVSTITKIDLYVN